jgi:hypothetical protein
MMSGLSDLEGTALAKVLRRTIVSSLIGGGGAIIVALLLSAPWAALGIVIGLGMAIVNLRFLDAGVAKVQTKGETSKKAVRRAMGAVTGLVIFQLFFVLNVGRVLMSQGIQ